jgi:hypothetical protein
MRTKVISLNVWLVAIQVPKITLICLYETHTLIMRHILLHYLRVDRMNLILRYEIERMKEILGRLKCARHVARWLVRFDIIKQFYIIAKIKQEDRSRYRSFDSME